MSSNVTKIFWRWSTLISYGRIFKHVLILWLWGTLRRSQVPHIKITSCPTLITWSLQSISWKHQLFLKAESLEFVSFFLQLLHIPQVRRPIGQPNIGLCCHLRIFGLQTLVFNLYQVDVWCKFQFHPVNLAKSTSRLCNSLIAFWDYHPAQNMFFFSSQYSKATVQDY